MQTGGQHHFYLERMTAFAIPQENPHMLVHIGNQAPDFTRIKLASILGVSGNQVTVESRRAGGGFGGKLTRHVSTAAGMVIEI